MPTDEVLTVKLTERYAFSDPKVRLCDGDAIDLNRELAA